MGEPPPPEATPKASIRIFFKFLHFKNKKINNQKSRKDKMIMESKKKMKLYNKNKSLKKHKNNNKDLINST